MTPPSERGLLDTSVFIASETGRQVDEASLPDEGAISTITVAELHVGVLAATDVDIRARRLATLEAVADIETLPIDNAVAAQRQRPVDRRNRSHPPPPRDHAR